MQALYRQLVVPEQVVPHAPQLPSSLVRSTHFPAHAVWPAGHEHTPFAQAPPVGQAVPQAPQLAALESTSTQA